MISDIDKSVIMKIEKRLKQFENFSKRSNKDWFSELCFCILTANSKAKTAIAIQKELGADGFVTCVKNSLSKCIKDNKHRFHNNKTRYIIEARKHLDIKKKVITLVNKKGEKETRDWLAENIKGIGYKEASHFLRNVGYKNIAILDRHILNLMVEHGFLRQKPKSLTKKIYHQIERKFEVLAKEYNMSPAKLDMYMWYLKTGEVLK